MKIQINDDERVLFVGKTGMGKTVLAKHFLQQVNRVLVIDPKHTFRLDGFKRRRGLPTFGRDWRIIYRPRFALPGTGRPNDDFALADLIERLKKKRDCTIYCDELATLSELFPASTAMLADVVRTGRELHVAVWSAIQRPRGVPRVFLTEAEVMFQFNLRSGEDRRYMIEFMGVEVWDPIPPYEFWYARAEDLASSLLRLDLGKGGIIPVDKLPEVTM